MFSCMNESPLSTLCTADGHLCLKRKEKKLRLASVTENDAREKENYIAEMLEKIFVKYCISKVDKKGMKVSKKYCAVKLQESREACSIKFRREVSVNI